MDVGVTNASLTSLATCGDKMIGSLTVLVNDGGVSRVNLDSTITGGIIMGPGSSYVKCEDAPISVAGDSITSHPPCPLPGTHCAAVTQGSTNVFTGGLFPPAGGGPLQIADLSVESFYISYPIIDWPVPTLFSGPITFQYVIKNTGNVSTNSSTIALYEVLGLPTVPPAPPILPEFITITRDTPNVLENIVLIDEKVIGPISAGGALADSWTIPFGNEFSYIPYNYVRYYILAVDIDSEVVETREWDNSSPVLPLENT
tara:strand:+ start:6135 stop:6908 length:774 start_codon:yes stop_codon:yes gene_type:complete